MDNTLPADEAATGATALSEALNPQPADTGAPEAQVAPQETAAPPAEPGAQPAPTAATTPAPQAPASTAPEAPKEPKWYREHMAKVNRERAAERAELERLRSGPQTQPQQRPQQPSAIPDPVDDPQGYHEYVVGQVRAEQSRFQLETKLNLSERFAVQQHGRESFEECQAWLSTKPELADWCVMQADPWGAAFAQYQRERIAEEIGDDPKAYEQRLREKIMAELQAAQGAPPSTSPASMTATRATPPAPASMARSAGTARDANGRFAPTPLSAALQRG